MANRDAAAAAAAGNCAKRSRSNFAGNSRSQQQQSHYGRRFEPGAAQSENNPSSSVAAAGTSAGIAGNMAPVNNNSTLARWPLAKYANLIASKTLATPGTGGTWQERASARLDDRRQPDDMWIQITQRRFIQVLHGDVLLESCPLSSARQEWRAMRKGPNMLFIVTKQGASRKFRIRFLRSAGSPTDEEETATTTKDGRDDGDASAAAQACARHLSSYFAVYDADRQGQAGVARTEDTDQLLPCQVSLQDIGRAALERRAKWPAGCVGRDAAAHESIPDLVLSCLMDPGFASFVEAVERSLQSLTTSCPGGDPQ